MCYRMNAHLFSQFENEWNFEINVGWADCLSHICIMILAIVLYFIRIIHNFCRIGLLCDFEMIEMTKQPWILHEQWKQKKNSLHIYL